MTPPNRHHKPITSPSTGPRTCFRRAPETTPRTARNPPRRRHPPGSAPLLIAIGATPLPGSSPSLTSLLDSLLAPDDGTLLLSTLELVAWPPGRTQQPAC